MAGLLHLLLAAAADTTPGGYRPVLRMQQYRIGKHFYDFFRLTTFCGFSFDLALRL